MSSTRGSRGGRRVQRSRQAKAAGQPRPNRYSAVAQALTPPARTLILQRWSRMNPHYADLHVDDILDLLYDADAYLQWTEPYWETHGERLAEQLGERWDVIGPAMMAVVLLGDEQLDAARFTQHTEQLARAAAQGAQDLIAGPSPEQ